MTEGEISTVQPRFIADHNVGKLARWLRMMGYDCLFFTGDDDSDMIRRALADGRIILTRDTGVARRQVAVTGRVKVVLITDEVPERQMRQVTTGMDLTGPASPFSRCLECNQLLETRTPDEVRGRVPPYVFRTRDRYMECPGCRRIYWQGTHWEAMIRRLEKLAAMP